MTEINIKSPGIDLITLKETLRHKHWNINLYIKCHNSKRVFILHIAHVIIIVKSGKKTTELISYRAINLLSIISKVLEKVIARKLLRVIENQSIIPEH